MNFSTIEESVLKEKKKFNNFLSRFLKSSRVLIILLTAAVITAVSVSIWIKSPEYQVLYNHLSNEDGGAIINELNQMKIPYQFTDISGQISVPKDKVYEIRLRLAENNLPRGGGVGFELLDKEKFGMSQFNEQINYHRALEGELARTIQRINIVKSARIHIAFPKTSLFLQDKKKSSASVVLELQPGRTLDMGQINAILHLVSSSISNLSVKNITIVDQLGNLLNQNSVEYDHVNDLQFKYSEEIESRYRNRIKNILEPLVGIGNVYAQVTAQIDFNAQEKTQEKYSPNTNHKNQSIRSRQISIHDEIEKENIPNSLSNDDINLNKNTQENKNTRKLNTVKNSNNLKNDYTPFNSNINRDNTINYELNHSVSHTKMNIGEIKRLSAAVIVNFIKDKNGKLVPLTIEKTKNIKKLVQEAIGYSKSRGDSIHLVNASFTRYNEKIPVQINNLNNFNLSNFLFTIAPWFFPSFFLFLLLKKYICSFSKKNNFENTHVLKEKKHIGKNNILQENSVQEDIKKNINIDKLIHQICNISNQNPRTIALIIRKWMSDKI
ncbi:flagellar basal body M-ring protein FliF [Buchnera aphidicola (Acyrthosiphon lactucae)]|uniref:Flagellar M-ring protein n=1 Tax=Buchnera aphidicola (Acyrthosiphon lactucae) TaxID=1241832 RepID=A0A4D6XRM2_9GAMM|nr:flagellar basal-body MS-ring/collar protein FliF [Buchnera aphidicola]QCI17488.1 flagellar basal body M-ring protein FliF [Buchnera aphidicola (Acyrthosiphon lactucae)]